MEGGDRRRRRHAELGVQQPAEPLVDHQRLGDVAAGGMDLHQHRVRALAKRLAFDQPFGPSGRVRQLRSAQREAGPDHHAHQPGREVAEVTTPLLDPRVRQLRQQRAGDQLQRSGGVPPGAGGVVAFQ
jgi:hypothetical protein